MNRSSAITDSGGAVVAVYAVAMAWVEAAVVYYLRTMVNRIEPHQPNPLPIMGGLGQGGIGARGGHAGHVVGSRHLGRPKAGAAAWYAAVAFGFWDISYYAFLKVLCGWPHSVFDWDILFLMPLPWWGPVLAPVLISLLMIGWGTLAGLDSPQRRGRPAELLVWVFKHLRRRAVPLDLHARHPRRQQPGTRHRSPGVAATIPLVVVLHRPDLHVRSSVPRAPTIRNRRPQSIRCC